MPIIELFLGVELAKDLMIEVKNELLWWKIIAPIAQSLNYCVKLFIIG
jgi:hypothetical protein